MLKAEQPQGSTKKADRTGCRGFSGCKHGVLQTGVERGWVCHLAAPLPGAREEAKSSPGTGSIHFHPKLSLAAFQERNQARPRRQGIFFFFFLNSAEQLS